CADLTAGRARRSGRRPRHPRLTAAPPLASVGRHNCTRTGAGEGCAALARAQLRRAGLRSCAAVLAIHSCRSTPPRPATPSTAAGPRPRGARRHPRLGGCTPSPVPAPPRGSTSPPGSTWPTPASAGTGWRPCSGPVVCCGSGEGSTRRHRYRSGRGTCSPVACRTRPTSPRCVRSCSPSVPTAQPPVARRRCCGGWTCSSSPGWSRSTCRPVAPGSRSRGWMPPAEPTAVLSSSGSSAARASRSPRPS
ncbi:MAG: hypothetical protein JWN55_2843, partial [Frankiales bacterium]|nr:hypothetical protein [Frankiales bacterium]